MSAPHYLIDAVVRLELSGFNKNKYPNKREDNAFYPGVVSSNFDCNGGDTSNGNGIG